MKVTELRSTKHVGIDKLNFIFNEVAAEYEAIACRLDEALSPVDGDLGDQLGILSKRFEAAKRGLGIVNRLPAGPVKTEHARRVMSNLNSIRAMLTRVTRNLEDYERAEQDYTNVDNFGSHRQVLPRNTFQPQPQAVEQNEEKSTESRQGWAHNTLSAIVRNKDGFCPQCNCDPCECSTENEEYCPDCDSNEHAVHPEMAHAARDSEELKARNLRSPFENEEEAECPRCNESPCECDGFNGARDATSGSKHLKDWNLKNPFENEEASACAHCKENPCDCAREEECPYCHKTICQCN